MAACQSSVNYNLPKSTYTVNTDIGNGKSELRREVPDFHKTFRPASPFLMCPPLLRAPYKVLYTSYHLDRFLANWAQGIFSGRTIGPRTTGPRGPTVRGPIYLEPPHIPIQSHPIHPTKAQRCYNPSETVFLSGLVQVAIITYQIFFPCTY